MNPILDQAHHDGLGLADSMTIYADPRDPNCGGASHRYKVVLDAHSGAHANVVFQQGPRHEVGSTPGICDGALLAIEIDRLRAFQEGPFRCRENAIALTHLEEALLWIQKRSRDRDKRGVLGKRFA